MKSNRTSTLAVVLIASASGLLACTDSSAKTNPTAVATAGTAAGEAVAATPGTAPDRVVVYYFHSTRRCPTCIGIQETIVKTIKERFATETRSGELTFREVNMEEPDNRHFVKEFSLGFSTMVVAANKGDATLKWENFDQVWKYAQAPEDLAEYTDKSVRTYLDMLEGN
ncbi:MAG: hypothetical protein A2289_09955 [Deltaproteobacteria bacterium RIFOXYA12_FULL_58_15]|nr:MAG: hypothetical protein A2289_09955 [Deltaproteobacteria bacterium RIFOXYA12_FULL_58_15]